MIPIVDSKIRRAEDIFGFISGSISPNYQFRKYSSQKIATNPFLFVSFNIIKQNGQILGLEFVRIALKCWDSSPQATLVVGRFAWCLL